jgi:hypothetical protein
MTEIESEFPALFAHGTRPEWGLGVLSGERDGKRSYLFEGGVERVMGSGAHDLMKRVSPLNAEQRATLARLSALVARRQGRTETSTSVGFSVAEQLSVLHGAFPNGFTDPAWQSENRAGRQRTGILAEAQEALSRNSLDALLKAQQFEAVWAAVSKSLRATQWLPADQLKPVVAGTALATLAGAVRELLHGSATLEQRVDRFVTAYESAFNRAPRWETTTALLALVFPAEHILIELASFRKQLKAMGTKSTIATRPSGAAYVRCANAARIVAGKLAESREVPQDLLDVHDFILFTLKAKPLGARAKSSKKAAAKPAASSDESPDSEELADDSE